MDRLIIVRIKVMEYTFIMNNIMDEAQLIVERIVLYCKPEKIILFGSLARGEEKRDSDIDLLIVKISDKKRPFRTKEIFEAIRGLERSYPIDPIVYTPEEIRERLAMGDYFIKEVFAQGKVMYGSR
jgi:predicted nucleotidyltransferase